METNKTEKKKLTVNPNTIIGSQYSQIVGITLTDQDATLEFVYVNPSTGNKGVVVSRVTLPIKVVKDLADKINSTVKTHEQKVGKKA